MIPLTLGPDAPRRRLQYATWVPGRDSIVFVFENNIYIRPLITSPEVVKITSTGINNVVYNGIPDWVYEGKWAERGGALREVSAPRDQPRDDEAWDGAFSEQYSAPVVPDSAAGGSAGE